MKTLRRDELKNLFVDIQLIEVDRDNLYESFDNYYQEEYERVQNWINNQEAGTSFDICSISLALSTPHEFVKTIIKGMADNNQLVNVIKYDNGDEWKFVKVKKH